jgi:hypothetical protein
MLNAVRSAAGKDASTEDVQTQLREVLREMGPLHAEVLDVLDRANMTRLDEITTPPGVADQTSETT